MTPRRRFVTVLIVTALVFAGMLTLISFRLHAWSRIGWAGINYFPEVTTSAGAKVRTAFAAPGRIIVIFPGSPAFRAGLTNSDSVRAINRIPIADQKRLIQLDRVAKAGDTLTYRIERGSGEQRDIRVRLESPVRQMRLMGSAGLSLLLAICFAVIGVAVYLRRPEDRRAFVFYAMTMVGALSFLGGIIMAIDASSLRGISATPAGTLPVLAAYMAASFAFATLTLHLSLVFPHERPVLQTKPWILRWIYILPLFATLFLGTLMSAPAIAEHMSVDPFDVLFGPAFRPTTIVLTIAALAIVALNRKRALFQRPVQTLIVIIGCVACVALLIDLTGMHRAAHLTFLAGTFLPFASLISYPILTFVALYRSYREAGVEEKRQVKWPLWGTMIALAIKIIFGASGLGIGILVSMRIVEANTWVTIAQTLELIPRLVYLLIPITFAVAILKYRLMNIDVIIKKTVAYGILSGLIIALYLILVGGLGTVLVTVAGVKNQTMVIASTLVVALVFVPLRNKLQNLVDRNLFRQKYDYPQALRAISAETLIATDLRSFLRFAAETLQQAVQTRSVVIFERRQDDLITSVKVGLPDSILGSIRMDATQAEAIDRPLNPSRRQLPDRTASALRRVDTALAVPIRSQGVLHGVVALGSKLSDREFDLEDLDFIGSAADQIAITIDRIRLQRDEEDFEQAREMQQALLPATIPQIAGLDVSGTWKPARDVSGDYYDLLELRRTQLGLCIGDVAGKGMPAALVMSGLQAAVRASAASDVSPAQVCERVRRVIVPSLAGGRFVTFFYCTIDTVARRIRYCNAGHNPPILVRADGSVVRLSDGGPALSRLFSSTPYVDGETELRDGDRLVLFTDGVSESRDADTNDYGEDRLERTVTQNREANAHDLVARIVDDVTAFSAARADDDLTMVAVAFTPQA